MEPNGSVTPGTHRVEGRDLADTPSRLLGEMFAEAAGYRYYNYWAGSYPVTGDASTWAVANGLSSIAVELPELEELNADEAANLYRAIVAVINR